MAKNLGDFFKKKISKMDGVPVEEVTAEYIRKQREKQDLPFAYFSVSLEPVTHTKEGLKILSNKELREIEIKADKFLSQF